MMRTATVLVALGGIMLMMSCASGGDARDAAFVQLAEQYIDGYMQLYPETATSLGDHRFDDRLDDHSSAGVKARIAFNAQALTDLNAIDVKQLSETNAVDYSILLNQVEASLFRLQTLREYEWNPLVYNVGGAIYYLIARDYAPIEQRMGSMISRLQQVREVTALAKANLKNPPKVHIETAIQQNQGTISLIEDGLEQFIAQAPELEPEFREAQKLAVNALTYYGNWLQLDLLPEADGEFRLGEDMYRKKLRYVLDSKLSMEAILQRATSDLEATQAAMYETAEPLYRQYFEKDPPADRKETIKAVLDVLAETRPDNDTIVGKAETFTEECRAFTARKRIVTVPDEPVKIIVMPEFQRGVAVAYCDAPGPFEPDGETFYAISPTPADWDASRVTSFFREYNDYMLQDLTIHEAIPGHYLQLAHANQFEAPTAVRTVFYSGPFVEGWATYAEQVMAEEGYGGPEVHMQQLKMRLRLVINSIIDQKIHTAGMSEQEAVALMMNEGFQEEGEAIGKWRRAQLTSTQLSTYYVGNIEVNDIRTAYRAAHGADAPMLEMHDKMLSFGSPPPRYVMQLLGLQ